MREQSRATSCSACLDSGRCWVCLGQGSYEVARGHAAACHACAATGDCPHCDTRFVRVVFLQRPA